MSPSANAGATLPEGASDPRRGDSKPLLPDINRRGRDRSQSWPPFAFLSGATCLTAKRSICSGLTSGTLLDTACYPLTNEGLWMDNFMDHLASELGQAGSHDLGTRSNLGIIFELVGSRRFLFTEWNVLIRRIGSFDRDNAEIVAQEFEILSSKSKSFLWGSG